MPVPIRVTGTNGEVADLVLDHTINHQIFSKSINFEVANVALDVEHQILEKNSTVTFDPALATNSVPVEEIILFPNPVKKEIYLKGITTSSTYEIYFVDGKLVSKGAYKSSQAIDVSKLNSGVYFLKINDKILKFNKN